METTQLETQLVNVVIRIWLKPERIQASAGLAAGDAEGSFALELAVNLAQPVTIELAEPKVAITLHGSAAAAPAA